MGFTTDQQKVIDNRQGNMVVSAGAGSGKTTVMTRRITQSVIEGEDINRFLIVTFTKAAAADVREKLYKALSEAGRKNPADRHINRQLMSLPGADISTVHAFCFSRIKQNFSALGLSPKVRAADDTESVRLMETAVEKLLQQGYERADKEFLSLADAFSGTKSDKPFGEMLTSLYKALRVYPNMWEFYDSLAERLEKDGEKESFDDTETAKILVEDVYENVKADREDFVCLLSFAVGKQYNTCGEQLAKILEGIDNVLYCKNAGYSAMHASLCEVKNPAVSKSGVDPADYEYIKETKKKITDSVKKNLDYFNNSPRQCMEDIRTNSALVKSLKKTLAEFDRIYTEEKRKNDCIDFADQEHLMLSLLEKDGQPTRLCLDLREGFDYIYIDEYQDTNPLQDRIFSLLSKDNRFMVGDVKQSIYRFRSAHPDIFKGYCKSYEDKEKGTKVILRENFRCDKSIIDFCNTVFSAQPMLKECLNYGEEALIYNKQEGTGSNNVHFTRIQCTEDEETKYTAEQMQEAEAAYIANQINSLLGQPKNDGTPIKYGDIAILFSALKSNTAVYSRVFEKAGIPFRTEKSENFLLREEVLLAIAALKTADNPTDDISLASVMRSPIFGFTADELYKIRRCSGVDSLYGCVTSAGMSGQRQRNKRYRAFPSALGATPSGRRLKRAVYISDTELSKKCRQLISRINAWRLWSEGVPAHRFIWQLYNDTGITSQVLSEKGGSKRYRNLFLLYEYARQYEQSGYRGLTEFLKYLDKAETLDEAKAPDDGGNTVKLMTIHRSKGLEFPVVFLADADRSFKTAVREKFVLRTDGIGLRFAECDGMLRRKNCVTDSLAVKELNDDRAEEARKLYVALTRARERLYVTAKSKDAESFGGDLRQGKCHADWINGSLTGEEAFVYNSVLEIKDISLNSAVEKTVANQLPIEGLRDRLSFVYPHGKCELPAKISVSEIRTGLLEEEAYSRSARVSSVLKKPRSMGEIVTAADKGTANHLFMQFASLSDAEKDGCKKEAEKLCQKGFVTPGQLEMMSFPLLDGFFRSELYGRMKASKAVFREKRFSVELTDAVLGGDGKENTLVQGVIDCFFEETDGSFTVVDYKTDRTRDREELVRRHKPQLEFYKQAVEQMTGKRVNKTVIYSFILGEVEV